MREKQMSSRFTTKLLGITLMFLLSSALALLIPFALVSGQQSNSSQLTFASPEKAAAALVQACETFDVPALTKILGPEGEDLVSSEDPVRDKNIAAQFAAKAHEHTSISVDPNNANRATLLVGNDNFPLAIPIVHKNGTWFFDTKAGKQEMLYRRIGANELDAIQICRGYVEAQHEYAMTKHDGAEVNQYAQRVISTPGTHDGLVWRNSDGTLGGPIAENIADALQQGYTDKAKPYHGYFFKILKGQGPAAPLGQLNFVVEGAMIGGFALAAAPADYRVTGVKTFIVGYDGIVYQKDLGPDTLKIFRDMELYNPDKSWSPTEDSWPPDAVGCLGFSAKLNRGVRTMITRRTRQSGGKSNDHRNCFPYGCAADSARYIYRVTPALMSSNDPQPVTRRHTTLLCISPRVRHSRWMFLQARKTASTPSHRHSGAGCAKASAHPPGMGGNNVGQRGRGDSPES